MATQTEEVRTKFVWDTADAEKGAQRVERAFDRLEKAEKGAKRGGHGGKRSENLVWALKDFAEGRTMFALNRMGEFFKGGGNGAKWFGDRLGGAAAVALVAANHVQELNAQVRELVSNMEGFSESSRKASRDSLFLTAGSGSGSLGGSILSQRERVLEGKNKIWEEEGKLDPTQNPAFVAQYRASQMLGKMLGIDYSPIERAKKQAQMSNIATAGDESRLTGLYSSAIGQEAGIAEARGPGGSKFRAERLELQLQKEQALSEVRKVLGKEAERELAAVSRTFDIRLRMVDAEERIAQARFTSSMVQQSIAGSGRSAFARSMATANARASESQSLINSGQLTQEQERAERLRLGAANLSRNDALMGRFLRPDGSRRRMGDVLRDFRRDRREARLRGRFLRQIERGGFDPVTGRRVATGDQPGAGLRATGGLQGASNAMSTGDFSQAFTPVGMDALGRAGVGTARGAKPVTRTVDDLWLLLDKRLPGTTK